MDDKEIVSLFLARNESAITETDKKYGKYCFYIAFRILRNESDSEEIVNDTYMKTWETVPPNEPDPLKPYVGKISRNMALDRYDKYNAQKRGGGLESALEELSECIPDRYESTDVADSLALTEALNKFLATLSERSRTIFIRRYWYACEISEIAEMMKMKDSAVAVSLLRSRNKLKKHLDKEGIFV